MSRVAEYKKAGMTSCRHFSRMDAFASELKKGKSNNAALSRAAKQCDRDAIKAISRTCEEEITDKAVCDELGVSTRQFRRWRDELEL